MNTHDIDECVHIRCPIVVTEILCQDTRRCTELNSSGQQLDNKSYVVILLFYCASIISIHIPKLETKYCENNKVDMNDKVHISNLNTFKGINHIY